MKKIQLDIPQPCHEDWDKMTQEDKGRFCGSCQKTVVDFSLMSDRQIAEFFRKPVGSVCGHFNQDQLNRDINPTKKRIPWIKYFFQFVIPAFLISAKATAQGRPKIMGKMLCVQPDSTQAKNPLPKPEIQLLEGRVVDLEGKPISFASIVIAGTKEGTSTNDSGYFQIKLKPNSVLVVSSVGFNSREIKVTDFTSKSIVLDIAVLDNSNVDFSGVVVITTHKKKKKENIPTVKTIVDTAFKNFRVYPNPAQNNSSIKIDGSKLEDGEYVLSFVDMKGEVMQTQEISLNSKKKVADVLLEQFQPGTYIVHLFNRKTAASFSEKIIVQ